MWQKNEDGRFACSVPGMYLYFIGIKVRNLKIDFNPGLNFSVTLGCGSTVSENNTYFVSSGSTTGSCTLKICECSDNICQVCKYVQAGTMYDFHDSTDTLKF